MHHSRTYRYIYSDHEGLNPSRCATPIGVSPYVGPLCGGGLTFV